MAIPVGRETGAGGVPLQRALRIVEFRCDHPVGFELGEPEPFAVEEEVDAVERDRQLPGEVRRRLHQPGRRRREVPYPAPAGVGGRGSGVPGSRGGKEAWPACHWRWETTTAGTAGRSQSAPAPHTTRTG